MSKEAENPAEKKKSVGKFVGIGLALLAAAVVVRITGLSEYVSLDSLGRLQGWINGFGAVAPVVFVAAYAVATVAFLPATPLTLLGGPVFGAVWGTFWIGATLGATLAFWSGDTQPGGWLSLGRRTTNGSRRGILSER